MIGLYLVISVALLGANGFFVAVEFSLVTSRVEKLEALTADGRRSAQLGLDAIGELSVQLAGSQLGITMASLGLGFVGEPGIAAVLEAALGPLALPEAALHAIAFAIALAVVTFLHLVLAEMVPKNLAIAGPERALLRLVRVNRAYMAVFRPVIRLSDWLATLGVRALGVEPRAEAASTATRAELALMVAESRQEGTIGEVAGDLLSGALRFPDRAVSTRMVLRDDMVTVDRRDRVGSIEASVERHGHSRLPVVGAGPDDVIGFVHVKDLLTLDPERHDQPVPRDLIRPMLAVDDDWSLARALMRMRATRLHLGLVTDRSGTTVGLVTLEDVLESLVGDIRDESDPSLAGMSGGDP